jgi:Terminase large subunit, T4likevirus-type, N-terminal
MYDMKESAIRHAAPKVRRELEVAEWARNQLGFEPDAMQTRVLNSRSKRMLLNCTRQWGKSTVTAAKAVYEALTHTGSLTIEVSPTARQTGEFVRKAEGFVRKLGRRTKGDGDNEMSLAFPNGSRIVGLPGTEATVRGFSAVSLLLVDEASRVSDDLYRALRPMLAVSDGTLWLMSTPFGKRGFFYETWAGGEDTWERVSVRAGDCPRISAVSWRRSAGRKGSGGTGRSTNASLWKCRAGCSTAT